ncbi:hypothetical protein GF402_11130 [Candidatus Fermentibacteria bacterium]|nr:hypothetical protein [Candidatus Fermentibacteria bacterium]
MARISLILLLLGLMAAFGSCGGAASGRPAEGSEPESEPEVVENHDITMDGFELSLYPRGDSLRVTMAAPTTGWVAIGFDPTAAMKDADLMIGYFSGGEVFLRDDYGTGHTSHRADTELGGTSDLIDVTGSEEDGRTTISFTKLLSSGDEYDTELVPGSLHEVLLAYGEDGSDDFDEYHVWVVKVEIEL